MKFEKKKRLKKARERERDQHMWKDARNCDTNI
jgi:hypothetical protein